MKTAEAWLEEMFGKGNWITADTITLKAIQLDAFKAGMTEANERLQYIKSCAVVWKSAQAALENASQAILSIRDNKTL